LRRPKLRHQALILFLRLLYTSSIPLVAHALHSSVINHFQRKEELTMLNWSITFLVVGLIAAVLGFTGIAGAATQIAWILFVVFLVLFLVSLFMGRGRTSL
jgi:uncharacterized membrane protein YtjA (UPF0391 family)